MGLVELKDDITIDLIDEATLFRGEGIDAIADQYSTKGTFPLLVHHGDWCSFFSLFMAEGPFYIIDKDHPQYYRPTEDSKPQLVTRLHTEIYTQICMISEKEHEEWKHIIKHDRNRTISGETPVYIGVYQSEYMFRHGYSLLKRNEDQSLSAIITGDDCFKQLEKWDVIDHQYVSKFF